MVLNGGFLGYGGGGNLHPGVGGVGPMQHPMQMGGVGPMQRPGMGGVGPMQSPTGMFGQQPVPFQTPYGMTGNYLNATGDGAMNSGVSQTMMQQMFPRMFAPQTLGPGGFVQNPRWGR